MPHYLVLTAIGTDRTGIVSELTQLVNECGCNIDDSRMAIFGNEFTFIMLLSGGLAAITQIENKLPPVANTLDLITMMKRTSNHTMKEFTQHFDVSYQVEDTPGILKEVTNFFAERQIDLSSLTSKLDKERNMMQANILISLTDGTASENLIEDFNKLCQKLGLNGEIKRIDQMSHF